jgi:hypothetical protein
MKTDRIELLEWFDNTADYGPVVGLTRLERYERSVRLGLDPPEAVRLPSFLSLRFSPLFPPNNETRMRIEMDSPIRRMTQEETVGSFRLKVGPSGSFKGRRGEQEVQN